MQKITSEQLRAWVDGELDPELSAQISTLVEADDELAEQAASFEASKLPFKAAMSMGVPPVPDALRDQVAQWSQITESQTIATPTLSTKPPTSKAANASQFYQRSFAAAMMALVVSWASMWLMFQPAEPIQKWTEAIVSYQNFYSSETVNGIDESPSTALQQLTQIKQAHPSLPDKLPNLSKLGYTFNRMQQLDFDNKPVLQMVFYKAGKRPLAICLMPDDDTVTERFTQHELLNSYVWQSGDLRGIVVGEESATELTKIAALLQS